jgi:hypothetical protein
MDHFTNELETYEKIPSACQYFGLYLHANFRSKKTKRHCHLNG